MCWPMTELVVQLENRRDIGRVSTSIRGASVYFSCTEDLAWTQAIFKTGHSFRSWILWKKARLWKLRIRTSEPGMVTFCPGNQLSDLLQVEEGLSRQSHIAPFHRTGRGRYKFDTDLHIHSFIFQHNLQLEKALWFLTTEATRSQVWKLRQLNLPRIPSNLNSTITWVCLKTGYP